MIIRISQESAYPRVLLGLLTIVLILAGCRNGTKLPTKSSKEYLDYTRSFYIGLSALQVGDDVRADTALGSAVQLIAAEPAGWINFGILALRQHNFDVAAERLEKARTLAPQNGQIYFLFGILESGRGNSAAAITALHKAVELNASDLRAAYKLAEELERQ